MNLPKTYQPKEYEANIYALWESSDAFSSTGKGEPYSIVMPPPNANANLHIGHSLEIIKDIMIRYQRMRGRDTIYIPGADHAGFETWTVFEKALERQGKSRFDFSNTELYQMTWDFVAENRGNMELQLRALGVSCDWKKAFFTLDKKVVDVVYQTFEKMWHDGLIYRGERVVNYCTFHRTGFADIEVDYREEKGKLWYISYPLESGEGSIEVATTRPETMLGDTAVAVNPNDKKYAKYIGKNLVLPVVNRSIPIVADEAVESEFGTGAVKVTPAHDSTDFEIGGRHNLPIISVIGDDGLMNDNAPSEFLGMDVTSARELIVEKLEQAGNITKIEDFVHQVPHCYKCGKIIQPLIKKQWFVSVKPLVEKAIKAVENGQINFTPKAKSEEMVRYYRELRDWNISRQIPWGIPIPMFKCIDDSREEKWIFNTRVEEEFIETEGVTYKRDNDTFDTWFSSSQLPYIVTDATTNDELSRFFPTTLMENGVDILRAWDSRMIMLSLYVTGKIPFQNIYLHGMVTDENNQKMSKSKGNVVNPMDYVAEYGSDALRMGIVANRSAGVPQAFSTATVVAGRNFCNKLWNIARYIMDIIATDEMAKQLESNIIDYNGIFTVTDHWILRQLDYARSRMDELLSEYRFAEAFEVAYHVIWDDVADWYIESTKSTMKTVNKSNLLVFVLEFCLKLAHPFAPFVTETIWQSLYDNDKYTTLLIKQQWPEKIKYDNVAAVEFERVKDLITEIRNLQKELGGSKRILQYMNDDLITDNANLIRSLARLDSVEQTDLATGLRLIAPDCEAWLFASEVEIERHFSNLRKRLNEVTEQISKLKQRLNNKSYVHKAPAELVAESRAELTEKQTLKNKLELELNARK